MTRTEKTLLRKIFLSWWGDHGIPNKPLMEKRAWEAMQLGYEFRAASAIRTEDMAPTFTFTVEDMEGF